jgi:hypothetical protein
MNIKTKTLVYFLIFCMGARLSFFLLAKYLNKDYLPYMGYIAIAIGIGFFTIYFTGNRNTGILDQPVWWNNLRPVHALLYFIFAYLAINQSDYSWIVLLIDVIIGLSSFVIFHKINGDI